MKITVTDGYTLNPGDLDWKSISELGELVIHDRTFPNQVVARCLEADVILTNKVPFSAETLPMLKKLKLISVLATGFNIVDIEACRRHGITVCNVPGYSTASVAQHVFALLLEFINRVALHNDSVHEGAWQRSNDFAYTLRTIHELEGKTFGIIGFGEIGGRVARIAHAFGMKVIFFNPSMKPSAFAHQTSMAEVFSKSDFVSLHCPLKKDNAGFVNAQLLRTMKRDAVLINTARGQLINEKDLADALNNGTIGGACIDVLSQEPPLSGNPLINAQNCIITPHIAWMSYQARLRIMEITANNIRSFLDGKPVNVVT